MRIKYTRIAKLCGVLALLFPKVWSRYTKHSKHSHEWALSPSVSTQNWLPIQNFIIVPWRSRSNQRIRWGGDENVPVQLLVESFFLCVCGILFLYVVPSACWRNERTLPGSGKCNPNSDINMYSNYRRRRRRRRRSHAHRQTFVWPRGVLPEIRNACNMLFALTSAIDFRCNLNFFCCEHALSPMYIDIYTSRHTHSQIFYGKGEAAFQRSNIPNVHFGGWDLRLCFQTYRPHIYMRAYTSSCALVALAAASCTPIFPLR